MTIINHPPPQKVSCTIRVTSSGSSEAIGEVERGGVVKVLVQQV
jgi:hypothetical protein